MDKRLLQLEATDLFGEKAIILSLSGREEISRPFEFMVTIASPKEDLKPKDVIGQPVGIRIDRGEEEPRYIHGYISHLWAGDFSQSLDNQSSPSRDYRIRLVPWLWFMTRAARCFVYLPEKGKKSIHDILDEVISRVKSYSHVESWNETASASILKSRQVEHCVQYRETDFNFLSRTLENYGVYYFFRFEKDKHVLILSDRPNYQDCEEKDVEYRTTNSGEGPVDSISSWEHAYEFVPGKWSQSDYNFETPSSNLLVSADKHSLVSLTNNSNYEVYDYPGFYSEKDEGTKEVERRLEEEESRFDAITGTSTCKTFQAGFSFKITKHPSCSGEAGKSYLITAITHAATQPGPFSGTGVVASYSNRFSCIPRERQFRPVRVTPRPMISSVQTAIVVGPPGDEIYTDDFGRVKVQFYWDREGKRDQNACCWIRVSQSWAGKGWGSMHIPHVGHEVVVAFLEGDPDRPLIVGRVYNAEQNVPMPLPAEKTRSVHRDYGGNETVMEGAQGKQFIHTQQTCGNEIIMDGSTGAEKIALKDKYGNQIVLDSVEKIIHIYCPTHESEIVLGRSVQIKSLSDLVQQFKGMNWTDIGGPKHENIAGLSSKLIGGIKQETVIGAELKMNLLSKFEMAKGIAVKKNDATEYEWVKKDKIYLKDKFLDKSIKTYLWANEKLEAASKEINDLADTVSLNGEKLVEAVGKELNFQAKEMQFCGRLVIAGAKMTGKSLLDWGNGLFKVKASSSKSPKAPKKRKATKAEKMSEAKKIKASRQAAKAARKMTRLRG